MSHKWSTPVLLYLLSVFVQCQSIAAFLSIRPIISHHSKQYHQNNENFPTESTNKPCLTTCCPSCLYSNSGRSGSSTNKEESETLSSSAREEAKQLLEKAKQLRESIDEPTTQTNNNPTNESFENNNSDISDTNNTNIQNGECYRLYIDIGREPGTWMDPRWGMSGNRVEFTLDIAFLPTPMISETEKAKMIQDNFGGKSSPIQIIQCISKKGARLRQGFDYMKCDGGGGYRLDYDSKSVVVRFFVNVDGFGEENDSSYGDISIPKGCLYFSLPCFGSNMKNLSMKEGPVTVRQMGWHTGWRREESRIVGTFKAVPLEKARLKDGF